MTPSRHLLALLCALTSACGSDSETPPPTECTPVCGGAVCGDDGCGGSCGSCAADASCELSQCVPNDVGLAVGAPCAVDEDCAEPGLCLTGAEFPNGYCSITRCGAQGASCPSGSDCFEVEGSPNLCLESCAVDTNCRLSEGYTCSDEGACVVEPICVPACDGKNCGSNGCGGSCGTCSGSDTCSAAGQCTPPICVPACDGKNCGSNGCGGSCGTCSGSDTCSAAGQCTPPVCVPQCSGKNCGSNGCGGSCGTCSGSDTCSAAGQCTPPICVPQCSGKNCGSNGCGGSCGTCSGSDTCSAAGQCTPPVCVPQCGGKNCGSNGCGGSCGTCSGSDTCSAAGQCTPPVCVPQCSGKNCGSNGCGGSCGTCSGSDTCSAAGQCTPPVCVPQCSGKNCGSNGCGGSCGTCSGSDTCSAAGQCTPPVCVPQCGGKNCGSNGCGGSCGTCSGSDTCSAAGQCTSPPGSTLGGPCQTDANCAASAPLCITPPGFPNGYCSADCAATTCPAGGSCWSFSGGTRSLCLLDCEQPSDCRIADGYQCDADNTCYPLDPCLPFCGDQECGIDGCGGSCGTCAANEVCDIDFQCSAPTGTTPVGGPCQSHASCTGAICLLDAQGYPSGYCTYDCLVATCPQGSTCASFDSGNQLCLDSCTLDADCRPGYECLDDDFCWPIACTGDCAGKQCGDDGCGQSCGACAGGATCNASQQCELPCEPDCDGLDCGDDSCGGTCGACSDGFLCDEGICEVLDSEPPTSVQTITPAVVKAGTAVVVTLDVSDINNDLTLGIDDIASVVLDQSPLGGGAAVAMTAGASLDVKTRRYTTTLQTTGKTTGAYLLSATVTDRAGHVVVDTLPVIIYTGQIREVSAGGTYPTIAAGITAAAPGDFVRLGSVPWKGTGNKNLGVGKAIVVGSDTPGAMPVIDCEGAGRAFHLLNSNDLATTVLAYFTVTKCGAAGLRFRVDDGASLVKPTLVGLAVTDNTNADHGGGLVFDGNGVDVTVVDTLVSLNDLTGTQLEGGGIAAMNAARVTLRDVRIVQNSAVQYGGGMVVGTNATLVARETTWRGNLCSSANAAWGGGLYLRSDAASSTLTRTSFVDNTTPVAQSSGRGGAIEIQSAVTIAHSEFRGNRAYLGGAIYSNNSCTKPIAISDSTFENNVGNQGGGIRSASGLTLSRTRFSGNSANNGGAVYAIDGTTTCRIAVSDCRFEGNFTLLTQGHGGAIHAADGNWRHLHFESNRAHQGAAAYIQSQGFGVPTIDGALFLDNRATGSGGAVYLRGQAPTSNRPSLVRYATFVDNTAVLSGAAVYLEIGDVRVSDSIFVRNGIFAAASVSNVPRLERINADPLSVVDDGLRINSGNGYVLGSSGNIFADPRFIAGPRGAFYLSQTAAGQAVTSPCVNPAGGITVDEFSPMLGRTTRTDGGLDTGAGDTGYHYLP